MDTPRVSFLSARSCGVHFNYKQKLDLALERWLAIDIVRERNLDLLVALDRSEVNLLFVKDRGIDFIFASHQLDATLFSYAMP